MDTAIVQCQFANEARGRHSRWLSCLYILTTAAPNIDNNAIHGYIYICADWPQHKMPGFETQQSIYMQIIGKATYTGADLARHLALTTHEGTIRKCCIIILNIAELLERSKFLARVQ